MGSHFALQQGGDCFLQGLPEAPQFILAAVFQEQVRGQVRPENQFPGQFGADPGQFSKDQVPQRLFPATALQDPHKLLLIEFQGGGLGLGGRGDVDPAGQHLPVTADRMGVAFDGVDDLAALLVNQDQVAVLSHNLADQADVLVTAALIKTGKGKGDDPVQADLLNLDQAASLQVLPQDEAEGRRGRPGFSSSREVRCSLAFSAWADRSRRRFCPGLRTTRTISNCSGW